MPNYKLTYRTDLGLLATFIPNKRLPVYNWYYYKEGYARDLVFLVAEMFGLKQGDKILDPFCGVGTTLVACRELGVNAAGTDVSPVAVFASRVKTEDYDAEVLREEIKKLFRIKFKKPEERIDSGVVLRSFSKYALWEVIFFRNNIMDIPDEKIRNFMMLGLMNASTKVSFAEKVGGSIRVDRKKKAPPLKIIFKKQLLRMVKDVERFKTKKSDISISLGDARSVKLENNSVDAIITSPPYLNKIEYTAIYSIELALFFGESGRPAIRSYIGEKGTEDNVFEGKYKLPPVAYSYFADMFLALKEMHRVLKKGGKAAIVIGNGCFPGGVVESDLLISELAEKIGFEVKQILVLNERWCMRERTIKVGRMRESLVVVEKEGCEDNTSS